ncbi:MAG TPA: response regulator [Gammaproteobacteria bacterium]
MARILVVDDSPTHVQSMIKILQKHGHETLVAETGEAAIESARTDSPDLILMDVVMPGLNGFQATRHITKHEATSHIPVIMISSKDQDTDRLWAERQGAKGYIIKPAKEAELMSTINSLLPS